MTHEDRLQAYRNASNHLSDAIMGWEALTVLIVNALHFESSIVGAYADGISILMWEKVEALKEVEKQFPDLAPADEDGVVCGRGRNPTLRLWPTIFSGKIDVFPGDRRSRLISSMTSVAPA